MAAIVEGIIDLAGAVGEGVEAAEAVEEASQIEKILKGTKAIGKGIRSINDIAQGISDEISKDNINDYKKSKKIKHKTIYLKGQNIRLDGKLMFDPENTVGHIISTGKPVDINGNILQRDNIFSHEENSYKLNNFVENIDFSIYKILNPRGHPILIKKNNVAGSIPDLIFSLYSNNNFIMSYVKLIQEARPDLSPEQIHNMSAEEIVNLFGSDRQKLQELQNLLNKESNYNFVENPKHAIGKIAGITERPVGGGGGGEGQAPIPVKPIKKEAKVPLWAPMYYLGGQNILRLTDTEKLEEMKNYTLYDLVNPLLKGDPENLLNIQNDIQQKLRFYNTYAPPKVEKELPPIPSYVNQYQTPWMNTYPIPYPFHLDFTGPQNANKYYNEWSNQDRTTSIHDKDAIQRSNLNPDMAQILNSKEVNKSDNIKVSDDDLLFFMKK